MKTYPIFSHEYFMQKAIQLAYEATKQGEIPVGAIIVLGGSKIIAKGTNQTENLCDVTAHAELITITAAAQYLGAKYLKGCTLYVTLEPCVMCAGALSWAQIDGIVFGASDNKKGFTKIEKNILHPRTSVISGILADECSLIIKDFFRKLRT